MAEASVVAFDVQGKTWEILDIGIGVDGAPSEARVRVPETEVQDWSSVFDANTRLYVRRDPAGTPEIVLKVRALSPSLKWGDNEEELGCLLTGAEWDLSRAPIIGQLCAEAADADLASPEYLTALKTVFNPDGVPNRHPTKGGASTDLHLFQPDHTASGGDEPDLWSVENMVEYVLQAYQAWCDDNTVDPVVADVTADVSWPSSATYQDAIAYGVNVHSLTVAEALTEILSRVGLSWTLKAQDIADEKHTLTIFARGDEAAADVGDKKDLLVPAHAGALPTGTDLEKAAAAGNMILDSVPVATKVQGYSNPKVYEDTFELEKGWSEANETYAFGGSMGADLDVLLNHFFRNTNPDTSADWDKCKWVGRRWILNDTGHVENRAGSDTPFDFSTLFGTTNYAKRPRPFLSKQVTVDADGKPGDVLVMVQSPYHAYQANCDYRWKLLRDVAGVLFMGPKFPVFPWRAMLKDDIDEIWPDGVWAAAAVEADMAYVRSKSPAGAGLAIPVEAVLDLDGKFQWDNVYGSGSEAEFNAYVDARAETWKQRIDSGRVAVEKITTHLWPGQWITSITGRAITTHAQVTALRWDVEAQTTHLQFGDAPVGQELEPIQVEHEYQEVYGPPAPVLPGLAGTLQQGGESIVGGALYAGRRLARILRGGGR